LQTLPIFSHSLRVRRSGEVVELGLVACCEWQQRDVPRLFDRVRQRALMARANTGQTAGNDLPALGHKLL
jgi:hypothetical protein